MIFTENRLDVEIGRMLSRIEIGKLDKRQHISSAITGLIMASEIPPELQAEILSQYTGFGLARVAVRSSATAEDSKENAWAGQLLTQLNVEEQDLLHAVKRCWSSLFSTEGLYYLYKNVPSSGPFAIRMAVVVQGMVDSEKSGVLFSINPITGKTDEAVIEVVRGLGEELVSGVATPESYRVDKASRDFTDPSRDSSGKALLSRAEFDELLASAATIEKRFGMPVDVEWRFAGG